MSKLNAGPLANVEADPNGEWVEIEPPKAVTRMFDRLLGDALGPDDGRYEYRTYNMARSWEWRSK